jgi:nucleotide-binding universal stress UspA family protein
MDQLHSKSVVVGIDGSQAAVNAAKTAVDEAISRQIPLRLVHVVGRSEAQSASQDISDWELECGEMALY